MRRHLLAGAALILAAGCGANQEEHPMRIATPSPAMRNEETLPERVEMATFALG